MARRATIDRDLPRNWLIRDDALAEIAQHLPKNRQQLTRIRGLRENIAHGVKHSPVTRRWWTFCRRC